MADSKENRAANKVRAWDEDVGPRFGRWWDRVAGLLLQSVLAVIVTWPLAMKLDSCLVVGTEIARTVPLFNAWTIWWNVDRVSNGLDGYWDAPIFLPAKNTFALSEPQPLTMLMAPAYWWSGSIYWTANLYLLICLALNGWVTQLWLRSLGLRWWIAMGGGAAMLLLPIVHWQIGVQQLVPVWGVIWTWWAFYRWTLFANGAGGAHGIEVTKGEVGGAGEQSSSATTASWSKFIGLSFGVALAFAVTMFACAHHGVFLALVMCAALPVIGWGWVKPRTWCAGIVTIAFVGVLVGPLAWHLHAMPVEISRRPEGVVRQLSLPLSDYAAVYGSTWCDFGKSWARDGWMASPGWFKVALAVLGVVVGLSWRQQRRWTVMMILLGSVSLALSTGPRLNIAGWEPWWWIADHVPGFAEVRNVFRFAYFVQMIVVLLAAVGVEGLFRWLSGKRVRSRVVLGSMFGAFAVAGMIDPWPPKLALSYVPNYLTHEDWLTWLAAEYHSQQLEDSQQLEEGAHEDDTERDGRQRIAALCLPMAAGGSVRDYEVTTNWMALSTLHRVPLANGYSGFFPPVYYQLRDAVEMRDFSDGVMNHMWQDGIRWIVIDTMHFQSPWESEARVGSIVLKREFEGKQGIVIFRLRRVE